MEAQSSATAQSCQLLPGETCLSDTVVAAGTYDLQRTPAITLRPFLNQLFRKCGMTMPEHIEQAIQGNQRF
jgi:hypothetical protein